MDFPKWVVEASLQQECRIYYMAKDRCTNAKNSRYKDYGGRGIEFKLTSFRKLIDEIGPRPIDGSIYMLDRKDNFGHYEHGNMRWATSVESNNNKRPQYNSRK